MSQKLVFKLFVQDSELSLKLLKYLDKNIKDIKQLGVRLVIDKISGKEVDDHTRALFQRKGIVRFPALIAPDGKPFIGIKNIVSLFETNLRQSRMRERVGVQQPNPAADMGTNADLGQFWANEMYSGTDKKGNLIPRKDKDEEADPSVDFQRRLSEYERKAPKHRRPGETRDIDQPARQSRRDMSSFNIDEIDEPEERPQARGREVAKPSDGGGDKIDQDMLAAWLDNNTG